MPGQTTHAALQKEFESLLDTPKVSGGGSEQKGIGCGMQLIIVLLLVLILGGFMAFVWFRNRPCPKDTEEKSKAAVQLSKTATNEPPPQEMRPMPNKFTPLEKLRFES